tara:strand:+ start:2539 stop:2754 length:216 start_codon:yes stop_codon:yes gene_type:complete
MNPNNFTFFNNLIIILLLCLILIFSFVAINLRPLARWANYQTICIEKESIASTIPWAVRKCNGRSKVYQVK